MSTAQLRDSRVEDESKRTPTTATYANPNGSWTTEAYAGVVRAQADQDTWVPVDADVAKGGGGYAPTAVPFDVNFSDGGDKTLGSVETTSKATVEVNWPSKLPAPTTDGDTLTYADSGPDGSDLVVTSRPDGFNYSMVLDKAPAADAAQVEYRVPLNIDGATVNTRPDGTIVLTDGKNRVATMTAPVMWDGAEANRAGNGEKLPVATAIEGSGGDRTLILRPDMEFLRDPATVYPVTVDPSIVVNTAGDTWVQSAGDTSSQYNSPELRVGSSDGGTTVARSYIYFDFTGVTQPPGTVFTSANMRLSNFESGSCVGSSLTASRITGGWTIPSLTWATQPTVTSANSGSSSEAFGATGCSSEGVMSFGLTGMMNDWAAGAWNVGVQVKADSETAASGFRKLRSLENGDLSKVPQLVLNYNATPNTPDAAVQVTPGSTSGSTVYTNTHTPTFSTAVGDPDGGNVTAQFQLLQGSTVIDDWTSGSIPSGSSASRTLPTSAPDGTYTAKWRVSDGTLTSPWSTGQTVVIDTTAPSLPAINCANGSYYSEDSWTQATGPGTAPCTVTVSSDTQTITASKNGAEVTFPAITSSSTSKTFTIAANDYFKLEVVAFDAAGNASNTRTYRFGIGSGAIDLPLAGATSTGVFPINATAFATSTSAAVQWRVANTTTFTTATKITKNGAAWNGHAVDSGSLGQTGDLEWDAASEPTMTNPATLDVRVCFNYVTSPTQLCTPVRQVGLIQHAFGGTFPTSDVGPASVALMTGEFDVDSTDVTVPGYADTLTISRTAQSFGTAASPWQAVFGPGWIANFDGPSVGFSAAQVVDKTATTGTISLIDTDGDTSVYKVAGTPSARKAGVYVGQGLAATYNENLQILTGGTSLVLTEEDGTKTTWIYSTTTSTWNLDSVLDPTQVVPATRFVYNTSGYLTSILSQAPTISNANCSATVQVPGCRALVLTYIGTGSATRLDHVDLKTYDPKPQPADGLPGAGAGMTSTTVAKYTYDTSNRLASAWDPRLDYNSGANHVATSYTYQTVAGHTMLATLTPAGTNPKAWNFNVDATGKLDTVTRAQDPAVGGTATWKVAYNVPLSGTNLPTMTSTQIATWGEASQVPTKAAAVFGPDAPSPYTDYKYADLTYFTGGGQTVNTVDYGAGAWQIDTTQYDPITGLTSWTLDAANRALGLNDYSWSASEIRNDLTTKYTYSSTGDRVEQVVGPNATVVSDNGTTVYGRQRTRYDYDDELTGTPSLIPGRPAVDAVPRRNLVVQETADLVERTTGNVFDPKVTRNYYNPVVAGDGDGWKLQMPTRVSEQLGSGWSTTVTRFDTQGRTIMTRTPQGVGTSTYTANDTRSTYTTYYAVGATGPTACQSKPQWADEVCMTGPGDGGATPVASTTSPTTTISGYDYLGSPARSVDTNTAGTVSRASVTAYDAAGRKTKDSAVTTNAPSGETALPDVTYGYEDASGALLTTTNGAATSSTTYDTWGRALTQTDGSGNTGTTTYDSAGRTATVNDGKGTYTYTYDGTDAAGKTERRGLVTSLDVGLPSGPDVFTAAYDNAGNQNKLVYPNGITAKSVFDGLGNQITLVYSNAGTDILGWIAYSDIDGDIKTQLTPQSSDTFDYDDRGRLTQVKDKVYGQCTTRQYDFSLDSNRNWMKSYLPASDGSCSTATSVTTYNGTFDADDKKTDSGNVYDTLGRTTTLRAADTLTGATAVNVGYYANDMVASLTQGAGGTAQGKSYGLDVAGRVSTMSSTTGGVELRKTQNQYSDDSDSPAWTTEQARPDGTSSWTSTWSRFVEAPSGDLGMIQKSDGTAQIQLTNMHGDVVSTLPNSTYAGLANYSESTEYGAARTVSPALNQSYTWLGAKRRSNDTLAGLTLMGARLYNPATGRFLSRDPVAGGNDNTYTYPVDPVNNFDLAGQMCFSKKCLKNGLKKLRKKAGSSWRYVKTHKAKLAIGAAGFAGAFVCGASIVCGAAVGASAALGTYWVSRKKHSWSGAIRATTWGAATGGLGSTRSLFKWRFGSRAPMTRGISFRRPASSAHRGISKFRQFFDRWR